MHGERAAEGGTARVADAVQIKEGLQTAVFAVRAVQGKICDVRRLAQLHNAAANVGRKTGPALFADRVKIGRNGADRAPCKRFCSGERCGGILCKFLRAEKQIDENDFMAALHERVGGHDAGGKRNVPLGRQTARKHYDIHKGLPRFPFKRFNTHTILRFIPRITRLDK